MVRLYIEEFSIKTRRFIYCKVLKKFVKIELFGILIVSVVEYEKIVFNTTKLIEVLNNELSNN